MSARDPTDDHSADGPLLIGRLFDGHGGGRPIDWAQAQSWRPGAGGEVLWLHLDRTGAGVREWLQNHLEIPEPIAELLTSDATRPRAFRDGETLIATLRGINFNPGADPEDMVSLQLWSDGSRVVTLRRHPQQSPTDLKHEIDAGRGPADAGALITSLAEHMVHRVNRVIVDMNDEIDRLEDADLDTVDRLLLDQIVAIRRSALALQRHMGPEHVALESIARDAPDWFEKHDRQEIGETIALLRRFIDDIDVSKESAVVLMDELRSRALARSEKTNRRLTLVATVFLPLSFFVGLFGINVGGMPFAQIAGHPFGFWIIAGLCVVLVAVILWLFRRWRWM